MMDEAKEERKNNGIEQMSGLNQILNTTDPQMKKKLRVLQVIVGY